MRDDSSFATISESFTDGVQTFRVLTESLIRHADSHDESVVRAFVDEMGSLFPTAFEESKGMSSAGKSENKDGSEASETPPIKRELSEAARKEVRDLATDTTKQQRLMVAVTSMRKGSPRQGSVLRESALVSVASHLEALIADLLHAYYRRFPEALPANERTLTLADLKTLGDVEDAVNLLISREVDAVLRESLQSQFGYFDRRLKLALEANEDDIASVIEVDQRRNLLVHNRGRVNQLYLRNVAGTLSEKYSAKDGARLTCDDEYVAAALDAIQVVGTILVQQCWRKWDKSSAVAADDAYVRCVFDALQDKRYTLVCRLAAYASRADGISDETRRIVLVNHAISLRDQGAGDRAQALIESIDWSATGIRFQIAVQVMKGEFLKALALIQKAMSIDELTPQELSRWPLFRPMRDSSQLGTAVAKLMAARPEMEAGDTE